MFEITFNDPTDAVDCWLNIRKLFGALWHKPVSPHQGPPLKLLVRDGRLTGILHAGPDSAAGLADLVELYGGHPIAEEPPNLVKADLSDTLLNLPLVTSHCPVGPLPFSVFLASGSHEQVREFIRWLMRFDHEQLGFALHEPTAGLPGIPVWLVAVEQLHSCTPFQRDFRDRVLRGVLVFAPLETESTLHTPNGFYLEQGFGPPDEASFRELWREYGGIKRQRASFRSKYSVIDVASPHFAPVHEAARLIRDERIQRVPLDLLPVNGQLGSITVTIEHGESPNIAQRRAKRRSLIDWIQYLEADLERLDGKGDDDVDSGVLLCVPQSAEAEFREVLRRTPDDVLIQFVYYARTWGGRRSHFIYPAAGAAVRSFPEVSGAQSLYSHNRWRRAGLNLFLPPDLRLSPNLHVSSAFRIRQALGGDVSSLFAFTREEQGVVRQFNLPAVEVGFGPLREALRYVNGCLLADANEPALLKTVDHFWKAIDGNIKATLHGDRLDKLEKQQLVFIEQSDHFFEHAVEAMNVHVKAMEAIRNDLARLKTRIEAKMRQVLEVDTEVSEALFGEGRPWQRVVGDLERLLSSIKKLLGD